MYQIKYHYTYSGSIEGDTLIFKTDFELTEHIRDNFSRTVSSLEELKKYRNVDSDEAYVFIESIYECEVTPVKQVTYESLEQTLYEDEWGV